MEDPSLGFFKKAFLSIIAVLLVLLAVVGLVAVFTINTDAAKETTYPPTTTNIYNIEEKEKEEEIPTNYQQPLPNQANSYSNPNNKNINVQTTVNVRTSGYSSYYPRYGYGRYNYRGYDYRYNYRQYKPYYPYPKYHFGDRYRHHQPRYPKYYW